MDNQGVEDHNRVATLQEVRGQANQPDTSQILFSCVQIQMFVISPSPLESHQQNVMFLADHGSSTGGDLPLPPPSQRKLSRGGMSGPAFSQPDKWPDAVNQNPSAQPQEFNIGDLTQPIPTTYMSTPRLARSYMAATNHPAAMTLPNPAESGKASKENRG